MNLPRLLLKSYQRLTGEPLIPGLPAEAEPAAALWDFPAVVVAHDTAEDPCFMYANRAALDLFEMSREAFIGMPSRFSAEPMQREAREQLLREVCAKGFTRAYSGVRVSSTGRRFRIENAAVWNLVDASGELHGQAATFSQWVFV